MAMSQPKLEGPEIVAQDSGTSTSVGAGFLEDNTKTFDVDAFKGYILIDSTAAEFPILSNTAIRINVTGNPAAGAYTVESRTGLIFLTPTSVEADAALALANAYAVFATDAAAGAAVPTSANIAAGKAAMIGALAGMSAPSAGLTKIPAAVQAFWTAAVAPPWPPAIGATPPPNASLAALFAATAASNVSSMNDLPTSMRAIATDMFNEAIIGGIMLIPPPPAGTPTPIL